MASIFSKIVAGEIPCYKVAEDENHLAFLDIAPVAKGHVLVIPKKEIDYVFDMEDAELAGLMVFAKKVAKALIKVCPAPKIGVSVIGLDVPHAHVHLVPIHGVTDIDFGKEKLKLPEAEMKELAGRILAEFENL
ncbi:MAG: HIT family protein [Bacteroidetes bacterium]|uniref:HIT family protein n=1 Tax=Candidatus Pullibacteroides excrementavium TaxID=2840905 RepID=A0A9D9DR98_9BACT|nr:HIT family protein [Candidatus Pullibacteroides excrementavium]